MKTVKRRAGKEHHSEKTTGLLRETDGGKNNKGTNEMILCLFLESQEEEECPKVARIGSYSKGNRRKPKVQ